MLLVQRKKKVPQIEEPEADIRNDIPQNVLRVPLGNCVLQTYIIDNVNIVDIRNVYLNII